MLLFEFVVFGVFAGSLDSVLSSLPTVAVHNSTVLESVAYSVNQPHDVSAKQT